jgi:lipid-A-disaccharide synthase
MRILMTAGEVSGDRQASFLAREILRQNPAVRLYGTGGEMMRDAGVEIAVQTSQYGSVGIQESLRFVRPLRRTLHTLRTLVRDEPPDLAVLVDNEGFNGVFARFLHREGIPFVYYFPPQVWLWGEWRAKRIARHARIIFPAFRPEAEIYRREGGRVEWYGHPLLDIVRIRQNPADVLRGIGLNPSRTTIGLMPGSRHQEIEELCDPILGAAKIILRHHPDMQFILPLAAAHLRGAVEQELHKAEMQDRIAVVSDHIYEHLSLCTLLILSSGTATLEGALLGIPMVAAYRVSPVTFAIGKIVVKSRFIAMPNILLNGRVIPEVIQEEVTSERLATIALEILSDPARRSAMSEQLRRAGSILGHSGTIKRVARSILREAAEVREDHEDGRRSMVESSAQWSESP